MGLVNLAGQNSQNSPGKLKPVAAEIKNAKRGRAPREFILKLRRSCRKPSALQMFHHPRHFQGRLRRLRAAIVRPAQAALFRLLFVFQQQHFVDDWDSVFQL